MRLMQGHNNIVHFQALASMISYQSKQQYTASQRDWSLSLDQPIVLESQIGNYVYITHSLFTVGQSIAVSKLNNISKTCILLWYMTISYNNCLSQTQTHEARADDL